MGKLRVYIGVKTFPATLSIAEHAATRAQADNAATTRVAVLAKAVAATPDVVIPADAAATNAVLPAIIVAMVSASFPTILRIAEAAITIANIILVLMANVVLSASRDGLNVVGVDAAKEP